MKQYQNDLSMRLTTRLLLGAALFLGAHAAGADPQPTGATPGVAFDNPAAGVTNITAPDNAIINYASFDVASGQTVNFIQPDAASRVLNRINSATPSQINGTINATGIVYFVNPSGVQFGPDSVVDAAGVFAAGASLSDTDFLNGVNQFNNVSGDITSSGMIRADVLAALIGRSINNTGTISVPSGTVIMASGDQVMIGSPLGGLMVQVDVTPLTGDGGVTQDGTVEAAEFSLVSGDIYSLALTNTLADRADATPIVTIDQIDTDGDGDIDNDDLDTAFANFTGPLAPGVGGKTQQQGDTDGDGDVDNTDLGTLIIYFTGAITPPPVVPPTDPAGPSSLRAVDAISELPPVLQDVNLTEADLSFLRDQLGVAARQPTARERIEHAQARTLYNDQAARPNGAANPDGSLTIANTRLDADVVRQALQLYRDRLEIEGVTPAMRSQQIRAAVELAFDDYRQDVAGDQAYDPAAFCAYVQQRSPDLIQDLGALNELRRMTLNMGLSELEQVNSEQIIVNRSRPGTLTFEQMKATLEAADQLSLANEPAPAAG